MKTIYKVEDTHRGITKYCLRKDFPIIFQSLCGSLRVSRMDEMALNPKMSLDDMNALDDFVSDSVEVTTFDDEEKFLESEYPENN